MSNKKKNKFIPISNKNDSNTFLMPGRNKCDCAATKHDLINNCTSCGRIVCAQEGSGQCWYCGELVCTNDELHQISNKSNKSHKLLEKLMKLNWPHQKLTEDINKISEKFINKSTEFDKMADERKQRLLEFDKTSTRRTKVIDDERDYYVTDGKLWIDPQKREILKQKENELRERRFAPKYSRPMTYTLDMKHGQLIEEAPSNNAAYELFEEPDLELITKDNNQIQTMPNINTDFLSFIDENHVRNKQITNGHCNQKKSIKRIQDQEIQEIRDDGMCMSMHQPWASLLVTGVKRHEGRSWYTGHRGILWIAATVKVPSPEMIRECEQFYVDRGVDQALFPDSYPTGCLLGFVNVTDCVAEDDYAELFPNGESGSPFVFLCEDARQLRLKFPIQGKHKIYKLDKHVHAAAKAALQRQ